MKNEDPDPQTMDAQAILEGRAPPRFRPDEAAAEPPPQSRLVVEKPDPTAPRPQEEANSAEEDPQALFDEVSKQWKVAHAAAVALVTEEVLEPEASGAERVLAKAAAHEFVLSEEISQTELEAAKRVGALTHLGDVKSATTLTKVLTDVMKARSESLRRGSDLIRTIGTVAARRAQSRQKRGLELVG